MSCPSGKDAWPELVGRNGDEAAEIIKKENETIKEVPVIHENAVVLAIYICDRVYVRVNDYRIVTKVPIIG